MYQFSYEEMLDDTPHVARERELHALEHSVELLEAADAAGPDSPQAINALSFVRRLWTVFMEDLAKPENELPKQLRADLISIGLFLLKETEQIRLGKSRNFRGLIEITQTISLGLK